MLINIFYMFVVYFCNQNAEHYSLPAFINMIDIANTKHQMFSNSNILIYIANSRDVRDLIWEQRPPRILPKLSGLRDILPSTPSSVLIFFQFFKCETSLFSMHLLSFSLNHQQSVHLLSVVLQEDWHRRTKCYDHIWVRWYMSDLVRLYWNVWLTLRVVA